MLRTPGTSSWKKDVNDCSQYLIGNSEFPSKNGCLNSTTFTALWYLSSIKWPHFSFWSSEHQRLDPPRILPKQLFLSNWYVSSSITITSTTFWRHSENRDISACWIWMDPCLWKHHSQHTHPFQNPRTPRRLFRPRNDFVNGNDFIRGNVFVSLSNP